MQVVCIKKVGCSILKKVKQTNLIKKQWILKMFRNIKIPIPPYFSFKETLSFLDRGFDECLFNLTDNAVSKLIKLSDGKGIIKIWFHDTLRHPPFTRCEIHYHSCQEKEHNTRIGNYIFLRTKHSNQCYNNSN